jgi:hypothetical protein
MLSKREMENLKEIEALARGGDAASQYRLAAMLERSGDRESAREWTRKAADAGHPGALYTLACELLSARPEEMRVGEAVGLLSRAREKGGAAAMRQLAVLTALGLGLKQDWAGAVALLGEAAEKGHPAAMRELALLAESVSGKRSAGSGLLVEAARKGDWIALAYAARRPGLLSERDAAAARETLRLRGITFIALDPQAEDQPLSPAMSVSDLAAIAKTFSEQDWTKSPLHDRPALYKVPALLTLDECDYVICASAPLMTPSLVVDPEKGAADHAQYRTSEGALISLLDFDLMLVSLYRRLAMAAGVNWGNCELIGVLRYRPGQEYKPHHDYLPEDANDYSEVRRAGQRQKTLLVSLNHAYAGGATVFPKLGIEHKGETGDAFVFENTDGAGAPYPETLHAGAPVAKGEKWLLSLWCRERRFWFWD